MLNRVATKTMQRNTNVTYKFNALGGKQRKTHINSTIETLNYYIQQNKLLKIQVSGTAY